MSEDLVLEFSDRLAASVTKALADLEVLEVVAVAGQRVQVHCSVLAGALAGFLRVTRFERL